MKKTFLFILSVIIDRTAPLAEGEPARNPNVSGAVKYEKEHDWYKKMPLL